MTTAHTYFESPIGLIEIQGSENFLTSIYFVDTKNKDELDNAVTKEAARQLKAYFGKKLEQFDLPLDARGTPFQKAVWQQLQTIPYGRTCSYGDIAVKLSKPKAVRAVGAANGKNPLSIVVPCHRVIGANGTLTGYAGGLDRKKFLLSLEERSMTD